MAVTGPVTLQVKDRLLRVYEQMPEPKHVIAIGTCAISGAPFNQCYNVHGGIDSVLPVEAYVPGCPPKPEAIIDGIIKLIERRKESEEREEGRGNHGNTKEASEREVD